MKLTDLENPDFCDPIHQADLQKMLSCSYNDVGFFLQTLANDGSTYTYWGDLQQDLYFISDRMRDDFSFERNMVTDLVGEWSQRIYNPIDRGRYAQEMEDMITGRRTVHDMRYQVQDKNGRIFWVHSYGRIQWDEGHTKPLFFCGKVSGQDVSLITDPVSDFAGEGILLKHLESLDRCGHSSTCIGFSLNFISKINSVQGRSCGNQLIRSIAAELMASCPARMPFYRLDRSIFVAVLSDTVHQAYTEQVDLIRSIITENYRRMGIPIHYTCSFAVLRYPSAGATPMDFLEHLIALVRLARQEPEVPYLDENSDAVKQLRQQTNLELLLNKNVLGDMDNFRPVVQPVVSTKTGKVIGGETLLRWKFDGIDVSPGIFIPIMEKSGLIQIAGRWIFEKSVAICKEMVREHPDFYLTVNVSLRQLYDPAFAEFIPAVLKKYDLPGRHIVVEMTESCIDQEPHKVFELFDVCARCGIRIALDDFGTGYSSMRVLLKYPLSIVKIDRSLLLEMSESQEKYNFISSIVFACHQFGKTVCIEGVENEVQRDLSRYAGCDMIQGFYYFRPTEIEELPQLLDDHT